MEVGVVFPQTEIGAAPDGILAYVRAVEDLAFGHLMVFDHVLGASARVYDAERLRGPYREGDMFHEVMVLFGFLAAVTRRVSLLTGVVVLPQRQAALVAKQAAEIDVLSGGRLRLGVGTGWNDVEYEALGVPFTRRGELQEEQIEVLRRLWTEPVVEMRGRWHTLSSCGINPQPVQRPIPIWLGGMSERVLERVGRLADGWIPQFKGLGQPDPPVMPGGTPEEQIRRVRRYAAERGRDPGAIGIQGRIEYGDGDETAWRRALDAWRSLGATHVAFNTMGAGHAGAAGHIAALERIAAVARDA